MARILLADRARARRYGATTTRPRQSFGHPSPDVPDLAPTRAPPLSSTTAAPAAACAPSYADGTYVPPDGKTVQCAQQSPPTSELLRSPGRGTVTCTFTEENSGTRPSRRDRA